MPPQFQLTLQHDHCRVTFPAMASTCEVLLDTTDLSLALTLGQAARAEALRIEHKYSRYREGNPVWEINQSNGQTVSLDEETAALIDFSHSLWQMSEGRFDITSGVLRKVWTFDGSDKVPAQADVASVLPHIGWHKVSWQKPALTLPAGMQIDLGGVGKEYAVDKVFAIIQSRWPGACLVNFGGDLRVQGPRTDGRSWQIGIEKASGEASNQVISLTQGALATSGDARRFLLKEGIRYSHILDPRSGWPVKNAPRSVSVMAPTCLQAGMLSSLAMLMGAEAETFLDQQKVGYWSER
ncbi:FAD:protein FMN transferase [Thalassolituus sp.]|uniref:FAD:protein FMN transferase n=1 Tax=Thalassolituus sp. TaxID=2030822 RepID=UPI003516D94B